jgi:transposase
MGGYDQFCIEELRIIDYFNDQNHFIDLKKIAADNSRWGESRDRSVTKK